MILMTPRCHPEQAQQTFVMWLVKVFPESKVTPRFLTVSVGEIEFPRSLLGNSWMRDSLTCLSTMIINSVFSGLSFSFTPSIHF